MRVLGLLNHCLPVDIGGEGSVEDLSANFLFLAFVWFENPLSLIEVFVLD